MKILEQILKKKDEPRRFVCFVKCETTGVYQDAPLTKLSIVKRDMMSLPDRWDAEQKVWLFNPGIPVSDEALKASGLTRQEIDFAPALTRETAQEIVKMMDDSVIVMWHPSFDVSHILSTFKRHGVNQTFILVKTVSLREMARKFMNTEKYTFKDALEKMGLPNACDAIGLHSLFCLLGNEYGEQLKTLFDTYSTGITADGFFKVTTQFELVYARGKHAGEGILYQPDYLRWVVESADVSLDTKKLAAAYQKEFDKTQII